MTMATTTQRLRAASGWRYTTPRITIIRRAAICRNNGGAYPKWPRARVYVFGRMRRGIASSSLDGDHSAIRSV